MNLVVRSDFLMQFFPGNLTVPENLGKETTSDYLTPMGGNNGASTVGVAKKMVAPLDSDRLKTQATKRLDELNAAKCGKGAHAMTATRWTPTN